MAFGVASTPVAGAMFDLLVPLLKFMFGEVITRAEALLEFIPQSIERRIVSASNGSAGVMIGWY